MGKRVIVIALVWGLACVGSVLHAAAVQEPSGAAARAHALWMSGKTFQAKALLERAAESERLDANVQFELARIAFYVSVRGAPPPKLEPAWEAIKKAVAIAPDNARYRYWAGMIAMHMSIVKAHYPDEQDAMRKFFKASTKQFEEALRLKPNYHDARLTLLGILYRTPEHLGGSRSRAEAHTKKMEELDAIYGAAARCQLIPREKTENRTAVWRKALAGNERNSRAHECLGYEYLYQRKPDKAAEHIEKALQLDPKRSAILIDLAGQYQSHKRFAEAEKTIDRFLSWKPAPIPPLAGARLEEASLHPETFGKSRGGQSHHGPIIEA